MNFLFFCLVPCLGASAHHSDSVSDKEEIGNVLRQFYSVIGLDDFDRDMFENLFNENGKINVAGKTIRGRQNITDFQVEFNRNHEVIETTPITSLLLNGNSASVSVKGEEILDGTEQHYQDCFVLTKSSSDGQWRIQIGIGEIGVQASQTPPDDEMRNSAQEMIYDFYDRLGTDRMNGVHKSYYTSDAVLIFGGKMAHGTDEVEAEDREIVQKKFRIHGFEVHNVVVSGDTASGSVAGEVFIDGQDKHFQDCVMLKLTGNKWKFEAQIVNLDSHLSEDDFAIPRASDD